MTSPEALRTWIKSELPYVQIPSEETLSALASNSTTHELWNFLTSRVRNPLNARAARAAIKLSGDYFTTREDAYERELEGLKQQVRELETEIRDIREELEADDSGVPEGVDDVIAAAFEERTNRILELVDILVEDRCADDDFVAALEDMGDVITQEGLDEIDELVRGMSSDALLKGLYKQIRQAEARILPYEATAKDMTEVMELHAVDEVLKTYKQMELIKQEHEEAASKIERLVEGMRRDGEEFEARGRMLVAQVDGERAFLAFLRGHEEAPEEAEVHSRETEVEEVENAAAVLVEGNLRILEEVKQVYNTADFFWEEVEAGVHEAVSLSERICEAAEAYSHGEQSTDRARKAVTVCGCDARREEIERIDALWKGTERGLRERVRMALETRQSVLERTDVKELERAIEKAVETREVEAVRVRDELRDFVRQPGRAAAPWLVRG